MAKSTFFTLTPQENLDRGFFNADMTPNYTAQVQYFIYEALLDKFKKIMPENDAIRRAETVSLFKKY